MKYLKELKSAAPILLFLLAILSCPFIADDVKKSQEVTTVEAQEEMLGQSDIFSPGKLEGWGSAWFTQPEFDGANMPNTALIEATNIDFGVKDSIAPRLGTDILGIQSSMNAAVMSLYTANSLDGRQLLVRTSSTTMEWWNPDDNDWDILDNGYTAGKDFTFVDGMTSTDTATYTYFSNGVQGIRRFRVGFGSVSDATASTTSVSLNPVDGFDSVDDIGFDPASGTITINGSDYPYASISGWTFQGMIGIPDFDDNEGVIQQVQTGGFTDAPATSVALVIKDQRLYASYNNSVYCSNIDDFQNFGFSSPRIASEGEIIIFPEGGSKINGLGLRQNYVAIFKDDYIGSLEFQDFSADLSDIPVVKTITRDIAIGAVSQKALVQKNFSIIFANAELGLTELTRLENKDYDQSIQLAERIRPNIETYDFTGSAVAIYENYILNSANDNSSFNNKVIAYNFLYNRFTEFVGINANSFAVYNGDLYYGDALTKNVYKMFHSEYSDNDLPYSTNWKTKWYNFGEPANWKELGFIFIEGFINKNTTLTLKVNMDEGGALTSASYEILGTGDYVASNPSSGFGTNAFGLTNFSNVAGSTSNLRHFAGFINTGDLFGNKFRNLQFEGSTSGAGMNYRISRIIPYVNILSKEWGMEYDEFTIP